MSALAPGRLLPALAPVLAALTVGALVLLATGDDPLTVYPLLLREAFGDLDRVAATLVAATPLLFTGLATAFTFRAGVFNVGAEGGFVLGGLAAATVGAHLTGLPGPLVALLALAAGTAAGMATSAVPGWLRARWEVNEVVITLMTNFIALGLAGWLVTSFLQAEGVANSATPLVPPDAWLPVLLSPGLTVGVLLGLALLAGYACWIRYSVPGYELRMTGHNPEFARAQGIRTGRVVLVAMLVSGAVAGLGGGAQALGVVHRFVEGFSPGYGFTGIAVALLGRNGALGVALGALFLGAMSSAGATVQLFSDIPLDIVQVLTGAVMIFAVARGALSRGAAR
ncbi:ABC transporter permease [Amycolatopsis cihanbeyliensis]|uniref:Nucleoside ABC transporter membrane protein n=1 Tax=Amycolatopsis cihanbeyliensis TaxID=1128664 RepID=A0A542DCZ4_AMYCI|nr:ABC transporter permease [Amycolatopsis cihanbeyliensis]TQJ00926.1 nucleoside ABC transporter membrane protein [Amycolatopsis cihanbeyliensis]